MTTEAEPNEPSAKAQALYAHLTLWAGAEMRLTTTGRGVAQHSGCAYSLVVGYLGELEQAGWIARRERKHAPTEIVLRHTNTSAARYAVAAGVDTPQPTPEPGSGAEMHRERQQGENVHGAARVRVQSSEFRVQSSEFIGNAFSDVRTKKENIKHACMHAHAAKNLNSELSRNSEAEPTDGIEGADQVAPADQATFEALADFRQKLLGLLAEYNINGKRRREICDAICALVARQFGLDRAHECLAEVKRGLEHARAKHAAGIARSAELVGAAILEDFAESGQLHLFAIPARPVRPVARQSNTGKYRREQATFSEEDRRLDEEAARQRLAAKRAATATATGATG